MAGLISRPSNSGGGFTLVYMHSNLNSRICETIDQAQKMVGWRMEDGGGESGEAREVENEFELKSMWECARQT